MTRTFLHPSAEVITLTKVLSALADPARLAIVRRLAEAEALTCGELAPALAKSTVSHHARTLREAGLTNTIGVGRGGMVSLRRDVIDARFPGLLDIVLYAEPHSAAQAD